MLTAGALHMGLIDEEPSSRFEILVVDDVAPNVALVAAYLTAAGYRVRCASGGQEAIASMTSSPPDLVLLDMVMPGMDGLETCRRMRKLPGGDAPIIFLTAATDRGSHERAVASGADDFLTKPIERTELMLRVRSLLWIQRLRVELRGGYELIREQRDELIRVQRQKEALTALVVHDLKNPLAAIQLTAEYIGMSCKSVCGVQEAAGDIVDAASAMGRMVLNLLDIARSEDGALVPTWTMVDVAGLLEGVLRDQTRTAALRQIVLERTASSLPTIEADADLLRRMLENLVENAIRHSPRGAAVRAALRTTANGDLEVRVSDSGSGVPDAAKARVFEKYVRLEHETMHSAGGNRGLGLTFCRLAAEMHGGTIRVEDNSPQGSVFVVCLPPAPPSSTVRHVSVPHPSQPVEKEMP